MFLVSLSLLLPHYEKLILYNIIEDGEKIFSEEVRCAHVCTIDNIRYKIIILTPKCCSVMMN